LPIINHSPNKETVSSIIKNEQTVAIAAALGPCSCPRLCHTFAYLPPKFGATCIVPFWPCFVCELCVAFSTILLLLLLLLFIVVVVVARVRLFGIFSRSRGCLWFREKWKLCQEVN